MAPDEKHVISFDSSAKEALERASGLPNLENVSDDDSLTDICMSFGAAAYYAQFFEAAIARFLASFRRLTAHQIIEHTVKRKKVVTAKTMGMHLQSLRAIFEIDPCIDSMFSEALQKRNYLMHYFFPERAPDFSSAAKQAVIFAELDEAGLLFKNAMNAMDGMTAAIERVLHDSDKNASPDRS